MSIWSSYDFTKIPFPEIERVGQRTLLFRDLFCVSWLLGRFCNYKCSYCWPYARSDEKDHRPTELVISTLDEIKRQARARSFNSFHFSFSGGEPTLHPGYLKVLQHYASDAEKTNYQSLHMTSNMSAGLGWLKKYVEATKDLHRVSITASYHKEFAVKESFADKLVFLQENDVHVTINSVMVPERFEPIWEDMLYFHERGINVTLKPQSNPTATKVVEGYTEDMLLKLRKGMPQRNYTAARLSQLNKESQRPKPKFNRLPDDQDSHEPIPAHLQVELTDGKGKAWYMDQAERFNAFEFNNFEGWECSAGFRSIIIREPDGLIKRSYSCNDQPLGHIETGFDLFAEPKPCVTKSCVSSADSKIPKRRAGAKLPLWPGDQSFV
jgi:organic radical activating enzyme